MRCTTDCGGYASSLVSKDCHTRVSSRASKVKVVSSFSFGSFACSSTRGSASDHPAQQRVAPGVAAGVGSSGSTVDS